MERRRNLIKAAISKWVKVDYDAINVTYLSGNDSNFYKVSTNIKTAKWFTSVNFNIFDGDETKTMQALKSEIDRVFK